MPLNRFTGIADDALVDLLTRYTEEYIHKNMPAEELKGCKLMIDEIINELSERHKANNKGTDLAPPNS